MNNITPINRIGLNNLLSQGYVITNDSKDYVTIEKNNKFSWGYLVLGGIFYLVYRLFAETKKTRTFSKTNPY